MMTIEEDSEGSDYEAPEVDYNESRDKASRWGVPQRSNEVMEDRRARAGEQAIQQGQQEPEQVHDE